MSELAMQLRLQAERDNAWAELRQIREAIGTNPEESTLDEVRRVVAERDALAARVAEMREALRSADFAADGWSNSFYNTLQHIKNLRDGISDFDSVLANLEECAKQSQADWKPALYRTALATPDDSAAILARRDATTLESAADRYSSAIWTGNVGDVLRSWAKELRARAAELGKAHGNG